MLARGADQIVLGCTHYPFLIHVLERILAGRGVAIVDPSPAVARRVGTFSTGTACMLRRTTVPFFSFHTFADENYCLHLEQKAAKSLL